MFSANDYVKRTNRKIENLSFRKGRRKENLLKLATFLLVLFLCFSFAAYQFPPNVCTLSAGGHP